MNSNFRSILKALNLAFTMVACFMSGFGVGYYLDSVLSTKPIFMIIGLFIGMGLALLYLFNLDKN